MDEHAKLTVLMELAESLGIQVRAGPAGDAGGRPGGAHVRLKGREMVFLSASASTADQIDVLAGALKDRPQLQDRFLAPEIRQLLEGG